MQIHSVCVMPGFKCINEAEQDRWHHRPGSRHINSQTFKTLINNLTPPPPLPRCALDPASGAVVYKQYWQLNKRKYEMKSHRLMTTKMPPWPPAINWPEVGLMVVKVPLQAERSRDLDCLEILNSSGSKPLWGCKLNPSNGCCHDGGGGETSWRRENGGSKLSDALLTSQQSKYFADICRHSTNQE